MPRINNDSEGCLLTFLGSSGIVIALKFAEPFAFLCYLVAVSSQFQYVLDVPVNYLADPYSTLGAKAKSCSHFRSVPDIVGEQ